MTSSNSHFLKHPELFLCVSSYPKSFTDGLLFTLLLFLEPLFYCKKKKKKLRRDFEIIIYSDLPDENN